MNKTRRDVLYLTYDGLADPIGQAQILPYLLACRAQGLQLDIISFEKAEQAELVAVLSARLRELGIGWERLTFSDGGTLQKGRDFLRFLKTAARIWKQGRHTVVHSRSYTAAGVGLWLKRRYDCRLLFDKRDFWIDAKIECGRIQPERLAHRLLLLPLRRLERQLFQQADHIISLTEKARGLLLGRFPQRAPNSITVIPCCVDTAHFSARPDDDAAAIRAELELKGRPVLGYSGSVGPAYLIPQLMVCFRLIRERLPEAILLCLVNNGAEEVRQAAVAAGLPPESLRILSATREQMPRYLSALDAGIYFISPTHAKQACSPTKLFEFLAMGKPVITNAGVGDVQQIFESLRCGLLLEQPDEKAFRRAAEWLAAGPSPLAGSLDHYSLAWGAEQYLSVYRKMGVHV